MAQPLLADDPALREAALSIEEVVIERKLSKITGNDFYVGLIP
jgi:hypothetical protein